MSADPSILDGMPPAPEIARETDPDGEVSILCAANSRPGPIEWLWNGWLAASKLHILAGVPGTGKTTLALALGAALTKGGRWPDGSQAPTGDVLVWSGEDDPRDTLVPRLLACAAELSRVHFVSSVVSKDGSRPFDPATDADLLAEAARRINRPIRLLIVDPIVSAVATDSHKNAEVRRALQPLVELGQSLKAAVLGITHFTKGSTGKDPVDRVTGSLAFGALARIVLAAAKLPSEGERKGARLLARAKSNIGPDSGGYEYHLDVVDVPGLAGVTNTRVTWGTLVEGTARELLGQAEMDSDPEERSALDEAKDFLRMELADGPVSKKEIERDADGMGISPRTLKRAKKDLGIEARKEGFAKGGVWKWALPPKGPWIT
jgi:putative DNA primase/helicase